MAVSESLTKTSGGFGNRALWTGDGNSPHYYYKWMERLGLGGILSSIDDSMN